MDTLDQHVHSDNNGIKVTSDAKTNFITISKWVRFLGVMGFVSVGLLAIVAFFMIIAGSTTSFGGEQMLILGLVYLIMACVYVFPALYLWRTSVHLINAFSKDSQSSFELGIENMKSFFKFVGIITIVIVSLYLLLIFFALFAATAYRF